MRARVSAREAVLCPPSRAHVFDVTVMASPRRIVFLGSELVIRNPSVFNRQVTFLFWHTLSVTASTGFLTGSEKQQLKVVLDSGKALKRA
jgi:hypothetical protein